MDITEARQLVVQDTREGDPEGYAGMTDDEVLATLPEEGVDLAEVEEWARTDVVSGELLEAYRLVIMSLTEVK